MPTQTNRARLPWIDIAKGYGTILVIYAHLGVGTFWTWMYSFHLPLFFFLSGYSFSTKYNFREFLWRRTKSIIIPYFCLGIPMILFHIFYLYINGNLTIDTVKYFLSKLFLQQRFWTLWFMACLFCLNIAFYLISKLCRKEWQIALLSIILACLGLWYYQSGRTPLYWNADVCLTAIPFFALGYMYKLHAKSVDDFIMPKSILFFFLFGVINIITWRLSLDETGLGLEMYASNYGHPIFTYLAAFAGIFCVIIVSKWMTIEPIRYIGENSMIYYAWHQIMMMPIVAHLLSMLGVDVLNSHGALGIIAYKWISVVIIIVALTFCNWCIGKLGLKFMVGK